MKRIRNVAIAALGATIFFTTTGCDSIRDYSVTSYQGVMPSGDMRPSGSAPLTLTAETPKTSTVTTPEVAPAAGAEGATKPNEPAK